MDALHVVLSRFGGQAALARALGVHRSTVCQWRRRGQCSLAGAFAIERATQGAVLAAELRPDVFGPRRQMDRSAA